MKAVILSFEFRTQIILVATETSKQIVHWFCIDLLKKRCHFRDLRKAKGSRWRIFNLLRTNQMASVLLWSLDLQENLNLNSFKKLLMLKLEVSLKLIAHGQRVSQWNQFWEMVLDHQCAMVYVQLHLLPHSKVLTSKMQSEHFIVYWNSSIVVNLDPNLL